MNLRGAHWGLVSVADATDAGCDRVREWLRGHNWEVNAAYMEQLRQINYAGQPLVLLAKEQDRVIGGLLAETQLAWLRISVMAVDPAWRSRGIGASLLAESERQAVARGCRYAYVDTMDYQAPGFYLARGFGIVGEIPDWDSHGHRKLYLSKRLGAQTGSG